MNCIKFSQLTAALLLGFSAVSSPVHAGLCQGLSIPAYFYPGTLWTKATAAAARTSIMIMNPNSGVGAAIDQNYVAAVKTAQAAGIKILGYVATNYADPKLKQTAINQINLYKQWYKVDGIFLDEVSDLAQNVPYYQNLAKVIRQGSGNFVMLNPGTIPAEGYVKLADNTIIFEDTYAKYLSNWQAPTWLFNYPASKFTHLVHTTSASQLANALKLTVSRNAGYVYVTHDVLDNPWDTLPTYWTTELSTMASTCKAP